MTDQPTDPARTMREIKDVLKCCALLALTGLLIVAAYKIGQGDMAALFAVRAIHITHYTEELPNVR